MRAQLAPLTTTRALNMKTLREILLEAITKRITPSEWEEIEIVHLLAEDGERLGQQVYCLYKLTRAGSAWDVFGRVAGYVSRRGEADLVALMAMDGPPV